MTDSLFDSAISPSSAVAKLQSAGIQISERTLRERARRIGAFREIGKAMFFMPEDIEKIITAAAPENKPCPTSRSAEISGTTVSRWTESDTENLLKQLKNGSQKTSRSNMKRGSVVPLSTVRKPS